MWSLWYPYQSNDNIGIKIHKGDHTSHKISLFGVFKGYNFFIYGVIIKKVTLQNIKNYKYNTKRSFKKLQD